MERKKTKNVVLNIGLSILSMLFLQNNYVMAEAGITARENLERLINTRVCRECDLSGLNLNRMDLSGADLSGADLSFTTCYLTNFSGANLQRTVLNGAVFGGADLGEADLRGADLRGANLESAYLGGTVLDGEMVETLPYKDHGISEITAQTYVPDQSIPKKNEKPGTIQVGKRKILNDPPPLLPVAPSKPESVVMTAEPKNVAQTDLPKAPAKKVAALPAKVIVEEKKSMAEPVVSKTSIKVEEQPAKPMVARVSQPEETDSSTSLDTEKQDRLQQLKKKNSCYGCDLSGLDLSGLDFEKADLEKANLANCNLSGTNFKKANLKGANLQNTNLQKARLNQADLYRAQLQGANVTGADLEGVKLDDANLTDTIGLQFMGKM